MFWSICNCANIWNLFGLPPSPTQMGGIKDAFIRSHQKEDKWIGLCMCRHVCKDLIGFYEKFTVQLSAQYCHYWHLKSETDFYCPEQLLDIVLILALTFYNRKYIHIRSEMQPRTIFSVSLRSAMPDTRPKSGLMPKT